MTEVRYMRLLRPDVHGFSHGGMVGTTYYAFCLCGFGVEATNPDGNKAVQVGVDKLTEHIKKASDDDGTEES